MLLRRIGLLAAVALTVGVLITSCATVVKGTVERGAVAPLTSEAALGDLEAVDFCSLLDTGQLARIDAAATSVPTPGIVYCRAHVTHAYAEMLVWIGNLVDDSTTMVFPDTERELPRSVLRQHFDSDVVCSRSLVFADDISVQIAVEHVDQGDNAGRAPLCEVADAVTDGVQTIVFRQGATSMRFPPGSLAELDPCAVLDTGEATDVFGSEMALSEMVGGHSCGWRSTGDLYSSAHLDFDVWEVIPDVSEYYTDEIAGRPSLVLPVSEAECVVETPHKLYHAGQADDWEVVTFYVTAADGDHCRAAEQLAEHAWPRLPAYEG